MLPNLEGTKVIYAKKILSQWPEVEYLKNVPICNGLGKNRLHNFLLESYKKAWDVYDQARLQKRCYLLVAWLRLKISLLKKMIKKVERCTDSKKSNWLLTGIDKFLCLSDKYRQFVVPKPDVYLSIYESIPYDILQNPDIKKIIVCHDLTGIKHPEWSTDIIAKQIAIKNSAYERYASLLGGGDFSLDGIGVCTSGFFEILS